MYQRMVLIVSLLLLVLIGGCVERQEYKSSASRSSASKQSNKADSSSMNQRVNELAAKIERLRAENRALMDTARIIKARTDSLVQFYTVENTKLKAQLAQARDEVIPAMRGQYEHLFSLQQATYEKLEAKYETTHTNLLVTEQECASLQDEYDELQRQLNQLRQWAAKWRIDAHRSFIKVMFGAGKAPVPEIEEPQLE